MDVKNPTHYQPKYEGGPECIQVMRLIWGDVKTLKHCEMNIFKYLFRYQYKNGIEDLEKIKAEFQRCSGTQFDPELVPVIIDMINTAITFSFINLNIFIFHLCFLN